MILNQYDDPLSLDAIRAYSTKRFMVNGKDALDAKGILKELNGIDVTRHLNIQFREIADKYKIIEEEGGETIYVPYGEEGRRRVEALRTTDNPASALKALQRYGVNLYKDEYHKMVKAGWIEHLKEYYPVLSPSFVEYYLDDIGLATVDPQMETALLMI